MNYTVKFLGVISESKEDKIFQILIVSELQATESVEWTLDCHICNVTNSRAVAAWYYQRLQLCTIGIYFKKL